jgi:hypothetical protein
VAEIESVAIYADGKVDSVILGVGGFLSIGERHVRVAWTDLSISDDGEKVVINANKDQLKGMEPYTCRDARCAAMSSGTPRAGPKQRAPIAARRRPIARPRPRRPTRPDRRQGPQRCEECS